MPENQNRRKKADGSTPVCVSKFCQVAKQSCWACQKIKTAVWWFLFYEIVPGAGDDIFCYTGDITKKGGFFMKKFLLFVLAIVISFLPGIIGMMFSPDGASDMWYNALVKPALMPAGWVFAVVWPILYFLLGIALYLIMVDTTRLSKTKSYSLFAVHMGLNALWSYLFFGINLTGAALIVLLLLIGFTVWMMVAFRQISRPAYYLVWPYIIWLVFALYLNSGVVMMN